MLLSVISSDIISVMKLVVVSWLVLVENWCR